MHIRHKQHCRVCGSPDLKPVIDLQDQYLQGSFVKPGVVRPPLRQVPTKLVRCDVERNEDACGLLQLAHSVPPEILYANYWYRSGTNQTMRSHLREIVNSAISIVKLEHKRVLDVGCNDGTLLDYYAPEIELWGFDPSDIAREITGRANIVGTVFPSSQGRSRLAGRKFDVITSIAMFYDLERPIDFAKAISESLGEKGIWIIELSYMPLMLKMNSFDTICHEHLEYYSLSVVEYIARAAGLRVFRAELNAINGGSIRCYLCHADFGDYDSSENQDYIRRIRLSEFETKLDTDEPYRAFQDRIEALRDEMTELLQRIHAASETVHVYGASTKGNVLLQWYNIDSFKVEYAADRNPQKHGARTLGTNIKIISEEESRALKPDYYLVLPWHFRREFLEREAETIHNGTKMLFPLPKVEVIDRDNLSKHLKVDYMTSDYLERVLGLTKDDPGSR